LQMSVFLSAVANGGTVYYPRLLVKVENLEGETKVNIPEKRVRAEMGVDFADMAAVRESLLAVVEAGTGQRAKVPGVKVAGKTGTGQFKTRIQGRLVKDLRTWFYCFAPYENPRYVVTVLVEGGTSGGGTCAPIAQKILDRIFAMERGEEVNMTYLTPTVGHFNGVQEIAPESSTTPGGAVPVTPSDSSTGVPAEVVAEDEPAAPSILPRRRF